MYGCCKDCHLSLENTRLLEKVASWCYRVDLAWLGSLAACGSKQQLESCLQELATRDYMLSDDQKIWTTLRAS